MSQQDRLVELEVRASFQERLIADLDEVVRGLADRVEQLESRVVELKQSLDQPEVGPANDPPPHY